MKTMTCRQLGGACSKEFTAGSFEEIADMSRNHGIEMFRAGDAAHIEAMSAMQDLMKSPDAMQQWMDDRRKEFDSLPEN